MVVKVLLTIAAIWLAITVIGFVVKGLFWIGLIGLGAFAITAGYGYLKRKAVTR